MKVWHTDAPGETGNLGSVPGDRDEDRRVPKNAERVSIVGVFPDVLSRKDHIFPESLLQTGLELVASTGRGGSRARRRPSAQRLQNGAVAPQDCNNRVLVER